MTKPNFQKLPKLIGFGNYTVTAEFSSILRMLKTYEEDCNLDLNPEFQRDYVWTEQQKTNYVEFMLKGGNTGRDILFNCPFFLSTNSYDETDPILNRMVIVDGKQRLSAILGFLQDKVKAFDHYYTDFTGSLRTANRLNFHINELCTRKDVLQWYLELNSGGTVHTQEELDKVRKMIEKV